LPGSVAPAPAGSRRRRPPRPRPGCRRAARCGRGLPTQVPAISVAGPIRGSSPGSIRGLHRRTDSRPAPWCRRAASPRLGVIRDGGACEMQNDGFPCSRSEPSSGARCPVVRRAARASSARCPWRSGPDPNRANCACAGRRPASARTCGPLRRSSQLTHRAEGPPSRSTATRLNIWAVAPIPRRRFRSTPDAASSSRSPRRPPQDLVQVLVDPAVACVVIA
jgi:hypothetical protein